LCSYWARGGDDCQQVYIGSNTNLYIANKLCEALTSVLVSNSMKEYENRAVDLAQHPAKLQALTNKLKEVRMTCPLFDTARWVSSQTLFGLFFIMATFLNQNQSLNANSQVRNLERAYYKMWNLYCYGRHPEPFKVREDDTEFPFDR
jgi:protein O-GlcNAc transferase